MAALKKHLNRLKPLIGNFLIASPQLHNPHFHQSVIILSMIDDEAVLGLVINKLAGTKLEDLSFYLEFPQRMWNAPILNGGPVDEDQFTISRLRVEESSSRKKSVKLDSMISIEEAIEEAPLGFTDHILNFHGHAAWGIDQLIEELDERLWYPMNMDISLFDYTPEQMWKAAMYRLSPQHAILSHAPCSPIFN